MLALFYLLWLGVFAYKIYFLLNLNKLLTLHLLAHVWKKVNGSEKPVNEWPDTIRRYTLFHGSIGLVIVILLTIGLFTQYWYIFFIRIVLSITFFSPASNYLKNTGKVKAYVRFTGFCTVIDIIFASIVVITGTT